MHWSALGFFDSFSVMFLFVFLSLLFFSVFFSGLGCFYFYFSQLGFPESSGLAAYDLTLYIHESIHKDDTTNCLR